MFLAISVSASANFIDLFHTFSPFLNMDIMALASVMFAIRRT